MLEETLLRISTLSSQERNRLRDRIGSTYIIAYQESTELLEATLNREGFQCEILRQQNCSEDQTMSTSHRCMLNHQRAWERASQATQPALIVEADFVPVVGMGQLPLPFDLQQGNVGMAWLYTCAAQLYSVTPEGFGEGYSTSLVAYVVTPEGARSLCGFVREITATYGTGYHTFDSKMDEFLRDRGFKNYIPFRNYGEHGGKPNPEHRRHGWSDIHQADLLYGPLAFAPVFLRDEKHRAWKFLMVRGRARLKGLLRLGMGRYLRLPVVRTSSVPWRLIRFAVWRHFSKRW